MPQAPVQVVAPEWDGRAAENPDEARRIAPGPAARRLPRPVSRVDSA